MKSGSWSSYQAAASPEARASGERDDEPTYNFMPSEPASCIAQGRGGEGVYAQRGCWWYFDGRNGAVQIPMLGHLNGAELLSLGRDTLSKRLRSGAGW